MNKLMQRIVTAIVLLAVLLTVFFILPSPAAVGVLGSFIIVAAWECSGFLSINTLFPETTTLPSTFIPFWSDDCIAFRMMFVVILPINFLSPSTNK